MPDQPRRQDVREGDTMTASTPSTPVTPGLPFVLQDVTRERARQIAKGYTPEHDETHATHTLVRLAEQRAHMPGQDAKPTHYSRQRLVEAIALMVAAVEALDRKAP